MMSKYSNNYLQKENAMSIRDETIKRICELLNEDIEDQFHVNELQAAIEGERCFCVTNKNIKVYL